MNKVVQLIGTAILTVLIITVIGMNAPISVLLPITLVIFGNGILGYIFGLLLIALIVTIAYLLNMLVLDLIDMLTNKPKIVPYNAE